MMLYLTQEDVERIARVKAILEKEFYKHYTCPDLAQVVGTNPNKLKITFKAVTMQNIYEYVTMVRINKAKDLLENTSLPIEVIAKRVGLDKSNLNKQFKRVVGMTPVKWKKIQRSGMWWERDV